VDHTGKIQASPRSILPQLFVINRLFFAKVSPRSPNLFTMYH
jgi:hypothetical protein